MQPFCRSHFLIVTFSDSHKEPPSRSSLHFGGPGTSYQTVLLPISWSAFVAIVHFFLSFLNCPSFELPCGPFWGQSTSIYTKLRVRYKLKYMCLICTQHQLECFLKVTSMCLNYCVWWQFITLVFVTCDDRSQDGVDWQMQGSHYLEMCIHFLMISRWSL